MNRYSYDGPVEMFDKFIGYWKAETYAETEKKAMSNLKYRYKKENGLVANTKIALTGKLNKEE